MIRIGMITPSSNTTLEPVTSALIAGQPIQCPVTRIRVQRIALDGAGADFDVDTFVTAAELLADAKVDAIAWNGTAGSWLGVDHDRRICTAITEATGVPATTATLGMLEAYRALGAVKIALATPYTSDVAEAIERQYAELGLTVTGRVELGLSDNYSFATQPPEVITDLVERAAAGGDAEAVAMVCTNVDAASCSASVEDRLGIPVVDSIAATLWHALHLAGQPRPISGYGRLLEVSGG